MQLDEQTISAFEKFLGDRYPQELQRIQQESQGVISQLGQQRPQTFKDKINPFLQAGMSIAQGFDETGRVAPMAQQMRQNYQDYDTRQTAQYQNPLMMRLQNLDIERGGLDKEYDMKKAMYGLGQDREAAKIAEQNRLRQDMIDQRDYEFDVRKQAEAERKNRAIEEQNTLGGGLTPLQQMTEARKKILWDADKYSLDYGKPYGYNEAIKTPQDLNTAAHKMAQIPMGPFINNPYRPDSTLYYMSQQYANPQLGQPQGQLGGQPQMGQPTGKITEADIDNMTEEELIRYINGQQ